MSERTFPLQLHLDLHIIREEVISKLQQQSWNVAGEKETITWHSESLKQFPDLIASIEAGEYHLIKVVSGPGHLVMIVHYASEDTSSTLNVANFFVEDAAGNLKHVASEPLLQRIEDSR